MSESRRWIWTSWVGWSGNAEELGDCEAHRGWRKGHAFVGGGVSWKRFGGICPLELLVEESLLPSDFCNEHE